MAKISRIIKINPDYTLNKEIIVTDKDGNEVSATLITTATADYTTVVSLASWNATFTDPDVAAQLGFSIINGTTNSPTVKFTPTPASINKANVTTEVCITSTYVDNSSPQKTLTDKQCVTISVDAGKVFTINTVSDAVIALTVNIDKVDFPNAVNSEEIRNAICKEGAGVIGNYTYCTTSTKCIGTFIPSENAKPYIGEQNKLEFVEEEKLEVICDINIAKKVIKKAKYEKQVEKLF